HAVAFGIDKLGSDPDVSGVVAKAPLYEVGYLVVADEFSFCREVADSRRGVRRHTLEARKAREVGDNVFRKSPGEVGQLVLRETVIEWQYAQEECGRRLPSRGVVRGVYQRVRHVIAEGSSWVIRDPS